MKVSPKQTQSRWKTGFLHVFLTIFLMVTAACDFDIPEKFEMPTWYIDLKIPLVQTRYEMSDISDSSAGIFLTDDSLGFKIVQEGEMPATELPDLPSVPLGLNQEISSGEIPGISMDIELPVILIDPRIHVVLYDLSIYQDTAKWCDTITIPILDPPFSMDTLICITDSSTGDTLGRLFSFPTDSVRHMRAADYNSLIVAFLDITSCNKPESATSGLFSTLISRFSCTVSCTCSSDILPSYLYLCTSYPHIIHIFLHNSDSLT